MDDARIGRSLLWGAPLVLAYSVANALVHLHIYKEAAAKTLSDPKTADAVRLVIAGWFVQDLLQGPVMWIVGSGLLWCGLSVLQRTRPFREILATTGVPFLAPALAMAAVHVALRNGLPAGRLVQGGTLAGLSAMLAWVVVRLRRGGVDALRGTASTLFAAGLYVLGRWLPTRLMGHRAK